MARPTNTSIRIDIHGLTVDEALVKVRTEITKAPSAVEKIVVIHGCNRGTALKEAIRWHLHSPRIQEIAPSFFNDGETVIWMRK